MGSEFVEAGRTVENQSRPNQGDQVMRRKVKTSTKIKRFMIALIRELWSVARETLVYFFAWVLLVTFIKSDTFDWYMTGCEA